MTSFNPDAPLAITWQREFGPILRELNKRLSGAGFIPTNYLVVARRILTLLQANRRITATQVIDAIYRDRQHTDWFFDRNVWLSYIPSVITALRSQNPRGVLDL